MQLKSSLWLNERQPVKVLKTLNDRQSHILLKFKESKEPIQFEVSYMSINNCQATQKSCIHRMSNAWFTLGSESKTLEGDPLYF